jgi:putative sigma-54 modulation protein
MKVAELTVHVSGRSGTIRKAVQSAEHMHEAIDLVVDKMDRQIREHKDRLKDHRQRGTEGPTLAPVQTPADGVARVKRFKLKPIPREQAQREMEALDHAFYLFLDEDSQEVNVLYRRQDGSLGLLEADLT